MLFFKFIFYKDVISNVIHVIKIDVSLFRPQREFNTYLKNLSNLNTLKVNKQFKQINIIHFEIDLYKKLNINLNKFKNKNMLTDYIKKLNFVNI